MNSKNLAGFTDVLGDEISNSQESQPLSLSSEDSQLYNHVVNNETSIVQRSNETQSIPKPATGTGQYGQFRSIDEIDMKYRSVFSYQFFNLVQSSVIDDALYSDKSMVVCAPTGSGKTVVFEMAIVQLLMEIENTRYMDDFKIIYMAPVKALCTERLTEWYPKFTKLGLMCIEVTGDTDVDFSQLKPYRIIITTPEKWDMVTRRWREHRQLVEVIKLFLIDEVHILNDESRGPVLEAVVSRMKTIESSAQSAHRIEQLQKQYLGTETNCKETPPKIRFVAVSATVSNPDDVAAWLGTAEKPAVYYKFGDESRPVKLKRIVEGYPCPEGTSIFKFDIILNYKLWPVIQKYHDGKPTLIFCNTRKSVVLTAETLSRELTVAFSPEQKAKLTALASTIKNKKIQALVLSGVGCHHAGLLFEERNNIERAFRNRDLPILITTTTLAMGVNLPAHLVIIKNTQQYVNGAYQEYSISTVLQMVGRAGRPQYDTEATAVIMTRLCDKPRYQALVGGSEPLQSYLHKRLAENLNSETALGTVNDVAQCVQWLRSTFLCVRAARDPKRYLGLPQAAPQQLISKKIEELCVKAMNGLATSGLITMDEASCIESTEAGRLMSIFYLDLETMKHIMKINGTETLERLLWIICESHELADMHLRVDERRCLNALNRNNTATTIRFPMKGKISTRQMKLNCIIQAILGCLVIPEPSLNQEAMKIMRIADRVCKCLVTYVTRPALITQQPKYYSAVLNALVLAKCVAAHMWENSPFVSKQLKGIGPTFSTLLATAGKVNFMLLEESHPRDLERIMNKGPPAGNVIRKQISLLPKYQLTMTPVNEKSVTIQLVLLNQNYLSENVEHLTAGNTHKSYIIVGDSENNLLLLTPFKDNDLISVYDGTITYQITRQHSFEHKIFAHCISSSFVGIDAQCDYLFKDLEAVYSSPQLTTNVNYVNKPTNKQTAITDTFKERKRKTTSENDVTQSKEKKKRDSALFEKLRCLKESFGKTSRELKENLDKSSLMSNKILKELTQLDKPTRCTEIVPVKPNEDTRIEHITNTDLDNSSIQVNNTEAIDYDDFMNDEKINSILSEIESEISKGNHRSNIPLVDLDVKKNTQNVQNSIYTKSDSTKYVNQRKSISSSKNYTTFNNTKKRIQKKSNYNFIDLVEKNINLSDEEENAIPIETSGFSDTIKNQIDKYLRNTEITSKVTDRSLIELLQVNNNYEKARKEMEGTTELNSKTVTSISDTESSNHIKTANAFKKIIDVDSNEISFNSILSEIESEISKGNHSSNELEESYTTNKKDNITMKHVIDSVSCHQDTNRIVTDTINCNNNTVKTDPNCCSGTNINDKNITKYFPNQIVSPPRNTYNPDGTGLNENNDKTQDLILCNDCNTVSSVKNEDVNTNFDERCHSFCESTTESNAIVCLPSTSLAMSYRQSQSLNCPEKPNLKQIICNENGTIQSSSDTTIKPSYSSLNPVNVNSGLEQFVLSPDTNYAKLSNQNINIKKYSCTSTKIDVATRDDNVTVIRKINLDFDITEIISRGNKEKYTLQEIDTNYERNRNTEKRYIDFESQKPLTSQAQDEEINNAIIAYCKSSISDEEINTGGQDVFPENNNKENLKTPKINTSSTQFNLYCQPTKQLAYDPHKTVQKEDNVINENSTKIDLNSKTEINLLENILQKYSKILRKNNTGTSSQNLTQPKVWNKGLSTPTEKPKRPFKITDIHNLNTPLPKTLIDTTPKHENEVDAVEQEMHNEMEQKKEITYHQIEPTENNILMFLQPKDSWKSVNKQSAIQNEDSVDNLDEEFSKFNLPETAFEKLEPRPTDDFNVDQSMLNPKMLLQCLSKDEPDIIVPPPPEFCDESELITPKDDEKITVPMDCYEPMHWDNLYEIDQTKKYVIEDDSHIELTPMKDIETWTLSQNDESYGNHATSSSFNPAQAFTIIHKPRQSSSPFQNVSVTRQNKLGKFKFCRKSKLLPK